MVLIATMAASGCGGGASSTTQTPQQQSGTVFVSGTDAPLPSVLSFQVDLTGLTVSDGNSPPVSVLNGTQTVWRVAWSRCRTKYGSTESKVERPPKNFEVAALFLGTERSRIWSQAPATVGGRYAEPIWPQGSSNFALRYRWCSESKMRLEQVRPDSAFWSSEMSRGVTWNPAASIFALVRVKDAGKITVLPRARALAAWGSVGSTSIQL
jgi:hypothetical protein